jgi:hypothetical protein
MIVDESNQFWNRFRETSSETRLEKQIVRMLRAELRCNDIEPVVSKWRLGQSGHFEVSHVVWSALSYVIDIFKDETVKAVTEEQKKAIFSVLSGRDTFVCLQTTVSLWITKLLPQKPVWYHVVKITRCHGNSCTRATENVSDLGRGLFSFEFPAQIETSASIEVPRRLQIKLSAFPPTCTSKVIFSTLHILLSAASWSVR